MGEGCERAAPGKNPGGRKLRPREKKREKRGEKSERGAASRRGVAEVLDGAHRRASGEAEALAFRAAAPPWRGAN